MMPFLFMRYHGNARKEATVIMYVRVQRGQINMP